jgi:hypothetical protein
MIGKVVLFLLVAISQCCVAAVIKPIELYSGQNSISANTYHTFYVDLSCPGLSASDFLINIDIPNFQETAGAVFVYVSTGSSGTYAPYPDPSNPQTFQWTTFNSSTGLPNPSVTIPNALSRKYYMTLDCPDIQLCTYLLVAKLSPSTQKITNQDLSVQNSRMDEETFPWKKRSSLPFPTFPQSLYYSNEFVVSDNVNFDQWNTYELPMCQAILESVFGSDLICLRVATVGQGTDFLFYQQVSTTPQQAPLNFWQTRLPNPNNPYADFSGKFLSPINVWLSNPVNVSQVPQVLYHSVVGHGGAGLDPPFSNPYSVYYRWEPCSA